MTQDTLDLGDNHSLTFSNYKGEQRVGAAIHHLTPDGRPCEGWLSFEGRAWANSFKPATIPAWTVEKEDPLTLSPSVLCACGDHGFVREGKWVRA